MYQTGNIIRFVITLNGEADLKISTGEEYLEKFRNKENN